MAETAPPGWIAALREDDGIGQLVRGIALAEGFHFYLLVCDGPRVAGAILERLGEWVAEEGGEAARVVRIDPYLAHADLQAPISYELLVDEVLAKLIAPTEEMRGGEVIVAVDASRALPQDDGAWNLLFQRMNERRNVIAKGLGRPLVLCLPRRLEPVFARVAADFWSIRSLAVLVGAEKSEQVTAPRRFDINLTGSTIGALTVGTGAHSKGTIQVAAAPGLEARGAAASIHAGIAATREALAKDPDDESALEALGVWLERLAKHELEWGQLGRALQAAEENVAIVQGLLTKRPEHAEWLRDLAIGLDGIGNVQRARGDLQRALAAYEEAFQILWQLQAHAPEHAERLRDLSLSLDRVGDVQLARGDLERALAVYEEGLQIRRRLLARDPERAERLRDLSLSLDRVGDVQLARGDLERALAAYEEGLRISQQLLVRDPERVERLRGLSLSLDRIGDVQRARGDLERALATYEEGLQIRRQLLVHDPEHAERLRDLSLSLERIGDMQLAREDLERALAAYEEGLQIRRRLLARDPERAEWLRDLLVSLGKVGNVQRARTDLIAAQSYLDKSFEIARRLVALDPSRPSYHFDLAVTFIQQARLAGASGHPAEALPFWREALAKLDQLTGRPSPLPVWLKARDECRDAVARIEAELSSKPH